ncbi:MAG: hypothetical protein WB781_21650, partial [Candidatus Sulfotelmatobacter sp.]
AERSLLMRIVSAAMRRISPNSSLRIMNSEKLFVGHSERSEESGVVRTQARTQIPRYRSG